MGAWVAVEAGVGVGVTDGTTTTIAVGTSGVGKATEAEVAVTVATGAPAKLQEVKMKDAARPIPITLKKMILLPIFHLVTL